VLHSLSNLKMSKAATSDASVALIIFVVVFLAFIIAPDLIISAIEYTVDNVMFVWHYWVNTVDAAVLLAANCTIAIATTLREIDGY